MKILYDELIEFIRNKTPYHISIKKNYSIITLPNIQYHVTIFQDQWDNYQEKINLDKHLFHISSDKIDNRCSSYFWVDMNNHKIQKIPEEYFSYGQEDFSFNKSTRQPCNLNEIKILLKIFQKILIEMHFRKT